MTKQQFYDLEESVSYRKLGKILKKLKENQTIKVSPELLKQVNDAVVMHRILPGEFVKMIEDIKEMQERIDAISKNNQESEEKEIDPPKSSSE